MAFTPSKYQQAIFEWAVNAQPGNNLVVQALAGSGKTTTLEKVISMLDGNILFVAFNVSIANELKSRLEGVPNAMVRTYHSVGLNILTKNVGRVQVDNDINHKRLKTYLDYNDRYLESPIKKLTAMVKNNLTDSEDNTLYDLASYYNVELNGDAGVVFDAVNYLLKCSKRDYKTIDFDDMIWLPNELNLRGDTYDWVLVDELQDTNKAQSELIAKISSANSRIICVGDSRQSCYAFRGANSEAMNDFITRWNADVLPLSITYRNPQVVVDLVRQKFPDIQLEGKSNNDIGIFETIKYEVALTKIQAGDMILCRVNADLVAPCFHMIRQGIKAIIRGRDIGSGMASLVKKMKANDLSDLIVKLTEYQDREVTKLIQAEKEMQAQAIMDKVETIIALSDGCQTVQDVIDRIAQVFSDDVASVTFSSIHRAKGLEAERVYILRPDLMPHPMAKRSWERQQEDNLFYVAATRSKMELYFVVGGRK